MTAQNLIIPAGTAKIGQFEYDVELNDSPEAFEALNDLPIKTVNGATLYVHDVAQVRDGSPPQTNVVRVNGGRSVLMTILKSGSVSTLAIVSGVKKILPRLELTLPPSFKVLLLGDQSVFVEAAVSGVIREGVIAAALTSLMILLFLGSWRSSLIISVSIPLAILISITALSALGQTLNVMTLGGLSLAVGILVDDATVTIENINFHLEQGKPIQQAIMDGARQIVTPAFVSLLCICIVFVPMFFLPGVSGFLFVPLAEAVVFAMIGSFILSRTLVPTLAGYLLRMQHGAAHERAVMEAHDAAPGPGRSGNPLARFQHGFERRFEGLRLRYRGLLAMALERRRSFLIGFIAVVLLSFGLVPFLGQNFFPSVDAGQIDMHVRVPTGTRIEETAAQFDAIEQAVRETIPPAQTGDIVDNIGLPFSGINLAFQNTGTIGPQDGDVYISLKAGHAPTAMFVKRLRQVLPERFPGTTFAFLPADIISQILNFGAPAPIDVQITGPNSDANQAYMDEIMRPLRKIPGLVDVRLQQATNYPEFKVDVNRTEADRLGVTERDVTNSLSTSLAGSGQTAPAYWLNPKNGVSYPIVAQSPQYRVDTLSDLENTPVSGAGGQSQLLGATAEVRRGQTAAVISHYAIAPAFDIFATTQDRDLGAVAADIQKVLKSTKSDVPKGAVVTLRGQVQTMNTAFAGLLFGLLGAFVLIYLIIVVNFQSWLDPFVIVTALPAALAGIVWMLFVTGTPLSVPALIGAIMCMGVATANSILVVSFCREQLEISGDAVQAALTSGFTRFRPVLMTALAMIIGLAPMALALGEGGEQNAPLGRAVIGGLLFATVATLLFVPVVFSLVHGAEQGAESRPRRPSLSRGPPMPTEPGVPPARLAPDAPRPSRRTLIITLIVAVLIAVALVVWGIVSRANAAWKDKTWTEAQSIPVVSVVAPSGETADRTLTLPGTLQAWYAAQIFARVPGYLRIWYDDIGARVKAGQVLAIIDTPELDAQIVQARADLASAQANMNLAGITARRWAALLKEDAVSKQEADEKEGGFAVATAQVNAAKASLDRLLSLKGFSRIVAPFNGVVTARRTDIGALVNAGSTANASSELFEVSQIEPLRLYVNVPQVDVAAIRPGIGVELTVPEYPGRVFPAKLATTSNSVSAASGTLLTELVVDNPEGLLKPGAYAQVKFTFPPPTAGQGAGRLQVPSSALLFRKTGTQLALLGLGERVKIIQVVVGRDFGQTLEITHGLSPTDKVNQQSAGFDRQRRTGSPRAERGRTRGRPQCGWLTGRCVGR